MKKLIILELEEMDKLGIDCGKTLAKINNGYFNIDIAELELNGMGISESVDYLISLTSLNRR